MGFTIKTEVLSIDTLDEKNRDELASMDSTNFKHFDGINKAISYLKLITFSDPKIIINSNLFHEFVEKLPENKSELKCTPKIIIFTKEKQYFIDNNENYIKNNDNSYIFLGIATTFEEIKEMLDDNYMP